MAMGGAEDDWEVVNDESFVYKRKRRRLESVAGASIPSLPAEDPEEEERRRRERKRTVLSKLKSKYRRELDQWECLSKTVKEMEVESRDCDRTESCCSGSISGAEEEMEGLADWWRMICSSRWKLKKP